MQTRQKVEHVNAGLNAMLNPKNPLHIAVREKKGCSLAEGKSWMSQTVQSMQLVCGLSECMQTRCEKMPRQVQTLLGQPASRRLGRTLPWTVSWRNQCRNTSMVSWRNQCRNTSIHQSQTASHLTWWSTQVAQLPGISLDGGSLPSKVEELYKMTVVCSESQSLVWPWRLRQSHTQYKDWPPRVTQQSLMLSLSQT